MIKQIAIKELTEIYREGRLRIAFAVVITLSLLSIIISKNYYESIQQQHAEANENARNIWVSQDEKNPHSAAHYGTYAFKPKYPLSLLDQGVDKFSGISIFLEAHTRNEAQFMAAADQTGLSRFGDLTPDFIFLFIIPLLIVLIGYNAFTREKELGTLQLLQSQGISLSKLAIGKWVGTFIPILLMATALFMVAGTLLGTLKNFGELRVNELVVLFIVYLMYYAIFTCLTLSVSVLVRNSDIALVIMLGVWILACFGAPKAATNFADTLYPYPTRQEFTASIAEAKSQGLDGHNPWSEESKQLEKEVLEEYGVDSVQQLPFNFDGYRMQKGEEHEAEIYFEHYNYLRQLHRKQTQIYRSAALFSPFLPTRFLSMAIARTDYQTHWDFADEAENYRIEMQKVLNTHFAENTEYGDWAWKADKSLWASIPDFHYHPPSLSQVVSQNITNLIVLLTWLSISFFAFFYFTRKL